jgi:hypothetical protein
MALVSGGSSGFPVGVIDQIRTALRPLKAALDERGNWEMLAHEHESKEVAKLSQAKLTSKGGRGGQKGGKGKKSGGPTSMLPMSKADLTWNPLDMNKVPRGIPRSVRDQVLWIEQKLPGATVTVSTSVVTESNTFVTVSNLPGATNLLALFDQYFIAAFSQVWYPEYGPGTTSAAFELHSAIDFDNTVTLGSLALIDAYSSSRVMPVRVGGVMMRSVRPCVAETAGSTANSTVERCWLDSAFTAIPHYGLRHIFSVAGVAFAIRSEVTIVAAFRSLI